MSWTLNRINNLAHSSSEMTDKNTAACLKFNCFQISRVCAKTVAWDIDHRGWKRRAWCHVSRAISISWADKRSTCPQDQECLMNVFTVPLACLNHTWVTKYQQMFFFFNPALRQKCRSRYVRGQYVEYEKVDIVLKIIRSSFRRISEIWVKFCALITRSTMWKSPCLHLF